MATNRAATTQASNPEGIHLMIKKLLLLAGLLGVAVFVVRKVKTANEERALWHEATTAPDLR
jgi:hypothetical protein